MRYRVLSGLVCAPVNECAESSGHYRRDGEYAAHNQSERPKIAESLSRDHPQSLAPSGAAPHRHG
jgi:hypothetical protein